jgi:hypothetical protein
VGGVVVRYYGKSTLACLDTFRDFVTLLRAQAKLMVSSGLSGASWATWRSEAIGSSRSLRLYCTVASAETNWVSV